jgi:hypothetical protein
MSSARHSDTHVANTLRPGCATAAAAQCGNAATRTANTVVTPADGNVMSAAGRGERSIVRHYDSYIPGYFIQI